MAQVITLTTDFGTSDAYVASMKGIILSINPQATIIDITHDIEPQNVLQAAFIINTAYRYFPDGTIHIVIVDPGVGSQRKSFILKTSTAFFLAPDNGVLSYVIEELEPIQPVSTPETTDELQQRQLPGDAEAIAITNPRYWQNPVSNIFHGRDIFAPVAAHLSLGTALHEFGEALELIKIFSIPKPYHDQEGNLCGKVIHIDRFGNLITNIKYVESPRKISVEISNQKIQELSQYYCQKEGLTALIGSSGYLEIALKNGSAAAFLNSKIGDQVRISKG